MKLSQFKALTFDCYGTLIDILHMAASPFHDHVLLRTGTTLPRAGFSAVTARMVSARRSTPGEMPSQDFRFTSLSDFAKAHRTEVR